MVEIFDYYAHGLDRNKDVTELHKKAKSEYLKWQKRSQQAKAGTPAANDALEQRKLWEQADLLFKTEAGRKKYDEQLVAWQSSLEAKDARGRVDQAAKEFASATETVLDLVARAWEELNRGNLTAASEVAAKAIRTDPSNWEAYLISGISSFRQDDPDEAMSCLRQAARLNQNSAPVFAGLGELYERMDNWKQAFANYQKASALEPDNADYQVAIGLVCVKAESPDEGIQYLRQALEKEPDHPGAKWALGLALSESARMGLTEVGDGHPRVPPGWYAMSRQQALQAVRKLHEATALEVGDEELTKHLSMLKADVDSNVERHFTGNWVLLCILGLGAVLSISSFGTFLLAGLFAAAYYAVNLVPQYATNARILAGDHAIKRGFFDWLDNLTNPWIKLAVLGTLFMFLPIFMIYWGIKNWTGDNAPLGDALKDIRGPAIAPTPQLNQVLESPVAVAAVEHGQGQAGGDKYPPPVTGASVVPSREKVLSPNSGAVAPTVSVQSNEHHRVSPVENRQSMSAFCSDCGASVAPDSAFCEECGVKL